MTILLNDATSQRRIAYATALLRISLGVMLLAHSVVLKFHMYTLPGTAAYFESIGFPAASAYLVFWIEVIAGVALVLGVGTRIATVAVLPVLLGALWVHLGNGWVFSEPNGGWEYPLYLVVLTVAQWLLGPGALQLGRLRFGQSVAWRPTPEGGRFSGN